MKKYKTLLFDVDDTLLDFSATEKWALRSLFEEQKVPFTTELEETYKKINQGLWKAFEEGKIDRDEVINTRFSILFKEYGQTVDGVLLENQYRKYLEQGHHMIMGSFELISNLQNHYDLYIVTNGESQTQDRRLRDSGLHPLFKDIFVSEDTGSQKPAKEYFDYVFDRIPNFSHEQAIIIGDSLTSDIKGGHLNGLDTCWFNWKNQANTIGITPTYQIMKLDELYGVLNVERELLARAQ